MVDTPEDHLIYYEEVPCWSSPNELDASKEKIVSLHPFLGMKRKNIPGSVEKKRTTKKFNRKAEKKLNFKLYI